MSVVIDEVVTDLPAEPSRSAHGASPGGGSQSGRRDPDLDRLGYQLARRRHRRQRLWAD
jgi:hypothetical protein